MIVLAAVTEWAFAVDEMIALAAVEEGGLAADEHVIVVGDVVAVVPPSWVPEDSVEPIDQV
jgi:hypothetical protein